MCYVCLKLLFHMLCMVLRVCGCGKRQTMNVFEISLNRIAKARHARGDRARSSAEAAEDAALAEAEAEAAAEGAEEHKPGAAGPELERAADLAPQTRSRTKRASAKAPASRSVGTKHRHSSSGGNGNGNGNGKKRSQFLDVHYRPLCDDPLGTVETIYRHFGMTLSAEARENMERWIAHVSRCSSSARPARVIHQSPPLSEPMIEDSPFKCCEQNPQNKGMYGKTKHELEWTGLTADQIEERCRQAADPSHDLGVDER